MYVYRRGIGRVMQKMFVLVSVYVGDDEMGSISAGGVVLGNYGG